jgi:hypothetical protein
MQRDGVQYKLILSFPNGTFVESRHRFAGGEERNGIKEGERKL